MKKIKSVEGLRGLAALIVVLHHILLTFFPALLTGQTSHSHFTNSNFENWYSTSPFSVITNGNFAVYIFFVLSGFVLSQKYFTTNDTHVLVASAFKRYLRLLIPVFATVTLAYLLIKLNLFYNSEAASLTKSGWWLAEFWNFNPSVGDWFYSGLFDTLINGNNKYDTVLWSMSFELYGSMFVFAVLALTHTVRNRWIIYPVFLFLFIKTGYFPYASFVIGILLSNYYFAIVEYGKKRKSLLLKIFLIGAGLFLGGYPSLAQYEGSVYEPFIIKNLIEGWDAFHFYGATLLVAGILFSTSMNKFLSLKPLQFLGKISFSLYLIHPIIIGSFSCWLLLRLDSMNYINAVVIVIPISILLILFISNIMAVTVDRWSLSLPSQLFNRFINPKKK